MSGEWVETGLKEIPSQSEVSLSESMNKSYSYYLTMVSNSSADFDMPWDFYAHKSLYPV